MHFEKDWKKRKTPVAFARIKGFLNGNLQDGRVFAILEPSRKDMSGDIMNNKNKQLRTTKEEKERL